MDNQKHEYVAMPKITKVSQGTNKKRDFEDENTKRRFINDEGKRSSADAGGNHLARGLEQQSLMDIQIEGELGEFIKVMRVLQDFPEVQSINIIQGSLKEFSNTKRFVYLSDGVMERKYVIAEVKLFFGKEFSVIEVDREDKHISTLIGTFSEYKDKNDIYKSILTELTNNCGTWNKNKILSICECFITLRHRKKDIKHRANLIINKLK